MIRVHKDDLDAKADYILLLIEDYFKEMSFDTGFKFLLSRLNDSPFILTIEHEDEERYEGKKHFDELIHAYFYITGLYESLFWKEYE